MTLPMATQLKHSYCSRMGVDPFRVCSCYISMPVSGPWERARCARSQEIVFKRLDQHWHAAAYVFSHLTRSVSNRGLPPPEQEKNSRRPLILNVLTLNIGCSTTTP